jgi:hypothetical protein
MSYKISNPDGLELNLDGETEVFKIDSSGNVKLKNGTTEHGTAGMIWCSIDADGTGKWQANAGTGDGVPNDPDTPATGGDPIKPTRWKNKASYWDGDAAQDKDGDITYTAESPSGAGKYEFKADIASNPQLIIYNDKSLVKAQHLASGVYSHPNGESTTFNIDWSNGNFQIIDFGGCVAGSVTINTPTNPEEGAFYTIKIIQGANNNTITWPVLVNWENGTPLSTPGTVDNSISIVKLVYDGVNYYASYENIQDNPSSTEYTALLSQVGTSAPTESVLNDTLTGGTWSYSSVGHYHYTKVGAFTNVNKVEVRIECYQFNFFTMTNNAFNMMSASRLDNDTILVKTANVGYVGLTGKGLTDPTLAGTITDFLVDDVLSNTPITIRVWS